LQRRETLKRYKGKELIPDFPNGKKPVNTDLPDITALQDKWIKNIIFIAWVQR